MKTSKLVALVVVSIVLAVLLATALTSFTRVPDSALAEVASPGAGVGAGLSRPSTAGTNYLPIIFLNSATAGGAWLLAGNAGTNSLTDFLGTTDNMTLTLRVSNTVAYRFVPAVQPGLGFAPNLLGGSEANRIAPGIAGATIAGGGVTGYGNVISSNYAFIGGGYSNTASGSYATVGGGYSNTASGNATVGGGSGNTASGGYATIGAGFFNTANGFGATVGGGVINTASGEYATIGGGTSNTASGSYATVGGGYLNTAQGDFSFAAGRKAWARYPGSFVWNDSSDSGTPFGDSQANEFNVRASGGTRIFSSDIYTSGVTLAPGSGTWSSVSDRNLKTDLANVDSRDILARVASLPLTTWNYKSQAASIRHIGPMAQDFYAAFNVGEDDKHIGALDEGGVALAAIQGLVQENKELKERNEKNEKELKELLELRERVAALEQNAPSNALSLNALAPWGVVGLLAVMWVRKKR
ncbi:MAG TPA: tail fiber domain-containing protein [Anaerolineae bacterium]